MRSEGFNATGRCGGSETCDRDCLNRSEKIKNEYSSGWAVRHQSIGVVYKTLKCEKCVEIGIARGEISRYLLTHVDLIKEYHAVDPFIGGYDDTDQMSIELAKINASNIWANAIVHQFKDYGCKFQLHHGLSKDMVKFFKPESIDCVFIDGDHRYEGVAQDIKFWSPILKIGGAYVFDDYSRSFMGVVKAVDRFVDTNYLEFVKINKHNNYYTIKKRANLTLEF